MSLLLQSLWRSFGDPASPSEWDGKDDNGGKGSQRFWEYHWVLRQLGSTSYVVDIGAGKGLFFCNLLMGTGINVIAVDPEIDASETKHVKGTLEQYVRRGFADYSQEWVTCISVLEHVEDKPKFCAALDLLKSPIAMTFESGPGGVEHKEMYRCFDAFTNHYLDKMERCPIWADNSAPDKWRPMGVVFLPFK